jgi:cell division protein FtsW (lipid II flippase)
MTNINWDKFFFGFFVLTVICGLYLIFQKDYVSGISGSITGLFLIYLQKMNKTKEKDSK